MAKINVYSTQGILSKAIDDVITASSPYANLTYEARIENVLNYYQTINDLISFDFNNEGYLNYGIMSDGRFAVDLDNYQIRYTGTFGYSSSTVYKIEVFDLTTNTSYSVEGSLNYSGVPFFTGIESGSKLTALESFTSSYEFTRVQLDGSFSSNGTITGTLTGIGSGYIKSGIAYLEVIEGGTSAINRTGGKFDVDANGSFKKGWVGVFDSSTGDTIDSITAENIIFPLYKKVSDMNLYEGADTFNLSGSTGSSVYAGSGDDSISGSIYSDVIYGESGNDTLKGGTGKDILDGGSGTDTADYSDKTTAVKLTLNKSTNATVFVNGTAEDTIKNIENITGGSGADILSGDTTNNVIKGGTGSDNITGGLGTDSLYGGADKVKDVFDFNAITESKTGTARDKVYDFITKIDKFDLSGIDANTSTAKKGDQAFVFNNSTAKANSIWYKVVDVDGKSTTRDIVIYGDVDGNTTADFEIGLVGVTSIAATDFVL
jgi:Ca2+-binding RTX toxin-like protein